MDKQGGEEINHKGVKVAGHQVKLPAASRSGSLCCCGGFTGLWTNRIGARAAILGCAKTCPEEIHPFTSACARAHTHRNKHTHSNPHPPCCFQLILKKKNMWWRRVLDKRADHILLQGAKYNTHLNNDKNHEQIMHTYMHHWVVTGWETTYCTLIMRLLF